jgi:hypothetical protein
VKTLIYRIVLLVLPIVLLAVVLEFGLGHVHDEYTAKAELFRQRQSQVETLFMGASPTAYGIDPSYMKQDAYNMGNFYQLIEQDTALVEALAPQMPHLKLVVFNIMPPILELDSRGSAVGNLSFKYHQLYGAGLDRWYDWFNLKAHSRIALFGYRNSIDFLFRGFRVSLAGDLELSEQGFVANPVTSSVTDTADDPAFKDQLARLITPYQGADHWDYNRKRLERSIKLLQENHIAVVFITSPVTTQYSGLYHEAYLTTKDLMEQFHAKYNVAYFDYFQDQHFSGEDFRDYLHLNSQGADKFSRLLAAEIMPLFYENQ